MLNIIQQNIRGFGKTNAVVEPQITNYWVISALRRV